MSQDDQTNDQAAARDAAPPRPERSAGAASRKRPSPPGPDRVGYGRPPEEHQFRPGQSGNPKGRPKGSKNKPPASAYEQRLDAMLLDEFYREVEVPVGGEMRTMTNTTLPRFMVSCGGVHGRYRDDQPHSPHSRLAGRL